MSAQKPVLIDEDGNPLHKNPSNVNSLGQNVHSLGQNVHSLGQNVNSLGQNVHSLDPIDDFTPIELESEVDPDEPSDEEIKEIERLNAEAIKMNAEAEAEADIQEEPEEPAVIEEPVPAVEEQVPAVEEAEDAVEEVPIITDPLKTENIVIPSKQLLDSNRIIQQLYKRNRFTLHTDDLNRLKQIITGEGLTCEDPIISEKKSHPDLTLKDQNNIKAKVNFVLCNHADVEDRTKWYVHLYFFEVEHPTIKSAIVDFFLSMEQSEPVPAVEVEEPVEPVVEEPVVEAAVIEEPVEEPEEPAPVEEPVEEESTAEKPYTFYPMKNENEPIPFKAVNSLKLYEIDKLKKELEICKQKLQTCKQSKGFKKHFKSYKRPYHKSPYHKRAYGRPERAYKKHRFHTRRGYKKSKRYTRRRQ